MTNESQENMLPQHPISLIAVNARELFIQSNRPPDPSIGIKEQQLSIGVGTSTYDAENGIIRVAIKLDMDEDADNDNPYILKIVLEGVFHVANNEVSTKQVNDWALTSSPYVLFPYLREHAFALTIRMGFKPLILPLLQIPT